MSMAHGVESRLPFLDHPLVELAATIPADIKFKNGEMKRVLKAAFSAILPPSIAGRQDKMGFPTPISEWVASDARDFVRDTLTTTKARQRDLVDNSQVLDWMGTESKASRGFWGLFSLELWQQEFHDKAAEFRALAAR